MLTFFVLVDLALAGLAEIVHESSQSMPYGGVHVNVALVLDVLLVDVVGADSLTTKGVLQSLKH